MKTLVALVALSCICIARPGENREALIKRFGKPVEEDKTIGRNAEGWMKFKSNGFVITCYPGRQKEVYELESGGEIDVETAESLCKAIADYREIIELKDGSAGQLNWSLGKFVRDKKVTWATRSADKKKMTFANSSVELDMGYDDKPNTGGF